MIYPNPGFPIYESMINFTGATAVPLPLREERGFAFDVDELASALTPKTKLLIINSPAQPDRRRRPRRDNAEIADVARRARLLVLADEIYSRDPLRGRA